MLDKHHNKRKVGSVMRLEATLLYSPPDHKWFAVINDLDGTEPTKVTDLEEDVLVLIVKLKEEHPDGILIKKGEGEELDE